MSGNGSNGHIKKTPEPVAEARRLYEEGVAFEEIGRRLGVSHRSIRNWLISTGVHPKSAPRTLTVRECQQCRKRQEALDRANKLLWYYKNRDRKVGRPQSVLALLSLLPPQAVRDLAGAIVGVSGWSTRARQAATMPLDQLLTPRSKRRVT